MLDKEPVTEAVKRWLAGELGDAVAHKGRRAQLARHCGVKPQAVSGWLRTGRIGKDKLELAAAFLGSRPVFQNAPLTPWTETHRPSAGPAFEGQGTSQAHLASQLEQSIDPPTQKWDSIMLAPLPPRFQLVIRDDAMLPMQPGHRAIFVPGTQARPGQVVLVVDQEGNAYIREYHERTPGRWQAVARSAAWLPLDSVDDGLQIVALQVGWTWD